MALEVRALTPNFAAEVRLDLSRGIGKESSKSLKKAFAEHSVLVFRDQSETGVARLSELASVFGRPSVCSDITNLTPDGVIVDPGSLDARYTRGNFLWHMDMLVLERPPLAAMLLARELPTSGEGKTQFADLEGLWSRLPNTKKKRLEQLMAVHALETIREKMGITEPEELRSEYPPRLHPLVVVDPISGRRSLFFGAHTSHIHGLSSGESRAILDELLQTATQEENIYTHAWRPYDLVVWSNRRVLHRVTSYDDRNERRRLWRVEVLAGDLPAGRGKSLWRRLLSG